MRKTKSIALGGMLSALSVVIMCLGGIIPFSTFICPTIAIITGQITLRTCGRKIGWCWYCVVAMLSLLFSVDKEAAVTFLFLGGYPMMKLIFDRYKIGWLLKLVYFNVSILVMYFLLIQLLGMEDLANEYTELGRIGVVIMLLLGNATFFLLDVILSRFKIAK